MMNSAARSIDSGRHGRHAAARVAAPAIRPGAIRPGWTPEAWLARVGGRTSPDWARRVFAPHLEHLEDRDGGLGRGLPRALRGAVAALGNFDGVHLGHQKVLDDASELAHERDVPGVVITFDPHPVRQFRPEAGGFTLTTFEQRVEVLVKAGSDAVIVLPFDDLLARITPEAFFGDYLDQLGGVVTGRGFGFGHRRAGSVETLAALARERGMASHASDPVLDGDEPVSSSRIRAALRAGDCTEALRLMTRPYAVEGIVRRGRHPGLGSSAYLDLGDYLRPRSGRYGIRAWLEDGCRMLCGSCRLDAPREAAPQPMLELLLPGLREEDFGERISVELMSYQGDEQAAGPLQLGGFA